MGVVLWQFANGLDTSPVSNIGAKSMIKTVGNSTTAPRDLISNEDIKITLMVLSESVSARLWEYGFICRTVQIGIRDNELNWIERQGKLEIPNRTAKSIFELAFFTFQKAYQRQADKKFKRSCLRFRADRPRSAVAPPDV